MAEQSWTDDPITAGSNRIRKKPVHFTELQDAINAWETAYSIGNTNFTDSPATGVKITSSAVTEMQDALDALYTLADSTSFNWTEASTPKTIKPVHINELRTNMNIMQNDYCYQCDSCDTYVDCNLCDTACDSDACDQCDSSCNGYSACNCDGVCYTNACDTCDTACHGGYDKFCVLCHNSCYNDACGTCYSLYGYSACTVGCNSQCYVDDCDLCDNACYEDSCSACHVVNYRYPWT